MQRCSQFKAETVHTRKMHLRTRKSGYFPESYTTIKLNTCLIMFYNVLWCFTFLLVLKDMNLQEVSTASCYYKSFAAAVTVSPLVPFSISGRHLASLKGNSVSAKHQTSQKSVFFAISEKQHVTTCAQMTILAAFMVGFIEFIVVFSQTSNIVWVWPLPFRESGPQPSAPEMPAKRGRRRPKIYYIQMLHGKWNMLSTFIYHTFV